MKKLFFLLIAAALLFSMTAPGLTETTEADEPSSIQEQLEKLWDFARSILKSQKERAVEKQLKAWKAKGAYVARTEIYIIDRDALARIDDPQWEPDFDLPAFDPAELEGFDEEVVLDLQRSMPALSALSPDELRERFLLYHPTATHILDVYAASYQDGAEALEMAQAISDAICELVSVKKNLGTPGVLSLPALLD